MWAKAQAACPVSAVPMSLAMTSRSSGTAADPIATRALETALFTRGSGSWSRDWIKPGTASGSRTLARDRPQPRRTRAIGWLASPSRRTRVAASPISPNVFESWVWAISLGSAKPLTSCINMSSSVSSNVSNVICCVTTSSSASVWFGSMDRTRNWDMMAAWERDNIQHREHWTRRYLWN